MRMFANSIGVFAPVLILGFGAVSFSHEKIPDSFTKTPCAENFRRTLQEWSPAGDWKKVAVSSLSGWTVYQGSELGDSSTILTVRVRIKDGRVEAEKSGKKLSVVGIWAPSAGCVARLEVRKALRKTASIDEFTDDSLKEKRVNQKQGIVFAWSPFMHYSLPSDC